MSDLISREALYEATKDTTDVSYMAAMILCAHAVDAVEVVRAKWITTEIYSGMYRANLSETTCSACGKRPNIYMLKSEYCPNCGAKMGKRRESDVSE